MRNFIRKLGLVAALMFVIPATSLAGQSHHVRESIQVADHFMFQPAPNPAVIAPGATILIRDFKAGVITATVSSAALTPNFAYSIWWVVFNNPQNCAIPYECAGSDLGTANVRGSVFWAGGILGDDTGYGNTQIELRRGRTDRELFGPMTDTGLRNLKWAEIHVVLRSHGDIGIAGTVAEQMGTANVACPPGGCSNAFFSVHRAK